MLVTSTKPSRSPADTFTAIGSTLASLMFFWAIIQRYCPQSLRRQFDLHTTSLMSFFDPYIKISIHEFIGSNLRTHKAYAAVEAYLSHNSSKNAKRLKAEFAHSNKMVLSMDEYEKVIDDFKGVKVWWSLYKSTSSASRSVNFPHQPPEIDRRYYRLMVHRKHRELVTGEYLEHVVTMGKEMIAKNRERKLFTNSQGKTMWSYVVFKHPATFDTLAIDPDKKQEIIEDLLTFKDSKYFYESIGKAWKRGYLLYGPPGTGKSTMIAAIANLLNYDVYDLELTSVKDNMELRKLLIETTSKSIIVIEDIDCSLDLTGQRKKQQDKPLEGEKDKLKQIFPKDLKEESGGFGGSTRVTLSGLLNFIDGLWSACGEERIIVFTTNYVDKLDPALTRRGRMDKHIELSYCSFEAFKILAKNYLKTEMHPLFESVRLLIEERNITPADVAENLMPKSPREDVEIRLKNLIQALEELKNAAFMEKGKVDERRHQLAQAKENGSVEDKQGSEVTVLF